MDFMQTFVNGLPYSEFLTKFGTDEHRRRWNDVHASIELSAPQTELLASFVRKTHVLVLAGTWCGDCVNQCPIFEHFSAAAPVLDIRYFDRDAFPALAERMAVCGGQRVPAVIFLSEDGQFCGQYGDRTLAKYRQMAADQVGAACPTGLGQEKSLLDQVVQDWLDEFERIQWMLRTSSRLRQKHGD